jgi:hypothetical protein
MHWCALSRIELVSPWPFGCLALWACGFPQCRLPVHCGRSVRSEAQLLGTSPSPYLTHLTSAQLQPTSKNKQIPLPTSPTSCQISYAIVKYLLFYNIAIPPLSLPQQLLLHTRSLHRFSFTRLALVRRHLSASDSSLPTDIFRFHHRSHHTHHTSVI